MRKLTIAVVLMLAAGLAVAQEPQRPPADPSQTMGKKEMTVVVVSADPEVKTITVKKDGAPPETAQETLNVAGPAVAQLATLKAGDKLKLVLTKDLATSKDSVTSIEKSKTAKP
jgi:hypothetical protein